MIKHYQCSRCKKKTSAEGIIPECKCSNPKVRMVEVKIVQTPTKDKQSTNTPKGDHKENAQ